MATDIIVRVDPKTLLVGPNVRKDVVLGKEFVASIKQHGVRVPISAQETEGGYEVVDGQRRTLAAVDAGLDQVPVVVIEREEAAARIVDQLVVNEHRAGISDADQIAAIKELSLFNMPAQTIARKVGMPKAVVETAIAVGSSERAVAALRGEKPVSFEDATTIAEFEGDEEAQADLVDRAASGYYIGHVAQEWRDRRGRERVAEDIKAMPGVTLIEQPGYSQKDPLAVRELFLDEERKKGLNELSHSELAAIAGDGLCAFPVAHGYGDEREITIGYAVKGWKDRGLFTHSWNENGATKPTTPEEAAKLKEERRQARENTKAWVAATAVRLEFLRGLIARRTPPKGWIEFVAPRALGIDPYANGAWAATAGILGLKSEHSHRSAVEKHLQAKPTAAAQVMLAAAAGAIEGAADFDRKGWWHQDGRRDATVKYLLQLQQWGYELSELEQSLVKKPRTRKGAA
jgi:ParB family chromosome partitioning protein